MVRCGFCGAEAIDGTAHCPACNRTMSGGWATPDGAAPTWDRDPDPAGTPFPGGPPPPPPGLGPPPPPAGRVSRTRLPVVIGALALIGLVFLATIFVAFSGRTRSKGLTSIGTSPSIADPRSTTTRSTTIPRLLDKPPANARSIELREILADETDLYPGARAFADPSNQGNLDEDANRGAGVVPPVAGAWTTQGYPSGEQTKCPFDETYHVREFATAPDAAAFASSFEGVFVDASTGPVPGLPAGTTIRHEASWFCPGGSVWVSLAVGRFLIRADATLEHDASTSHFVAQFTRIADAFATLP